MALMLVDRVSRYPGRVLVVPENGESFYATIVRADEPYTEGTPINASTLEELVRQEVLEATTVTP